jgi:cytohesin
LLDAAKVGSVASAEKLLADGANIEARNREAPGTDRQWADEFTPLALAIARGDRAMVKMLLDHGADINAKTKPQDGFPGRDIVLWTAVAQGHTEIVRLLVDNGARVDVTGSSGMTPLMLAARDNNVEIVRLLIQRGANVNARDERGFTPLSFATGKRRTDHSAVIRLLRKAGARP